MKIVIDIPETLKKIADEEDIKTFSHFMWSTIIMDAIKNGTPLPKGHGRLIDDGVLKERFHGVDDAGTFIYIDKLLEAIDHAPTIIEADRGE